MRYELDIATQQMIGGHCRVMPVLIDDVDVPPEVEGLLYADLRLRRRGGFKAILRTLQSEADKYPQPAEPATMTASNSWVRDRAYRAHLGGLSDGYFDASMDVSATRSVDFEGFSLNERAVVVSFVSRYGREPALTVHDFEDWNHFVEEEINEDCGLLVSEQPPDGTLTEKLNFEERIGSEVTKDLFKPSGLLVVADISGELTDAEKADVLTRSVDKLRAAIETSEPPPLDLEAIRAAARED